MYDLNTERRRWEQGFFKGVASPTLTVGAMNAVLFLSYETTCKWMRSRHGAEELSLKEIFAAGVAAGVKCIAQLDVKSKGHVVEELRIIKRMVREHGVLGKHGPTRGLLMTMVRDAPSFGLYFVIYEDICRR
ncbi:hypothetical protein GUITHDRAFT_118098 [Guillardia theta CCMP2712]|uniref:Uncharacterized protein n=1 Tax=Guillardia theta (strain CCMP2712) TaxID=905079 RepID=L1IHY0_GUITC|nr:hypothetical protein GUITHDRAFT_118098 [Guillardia theta CCMP2712]EKX35712.1 hypothetical protein GUITHDRAFT_118098 [Guillardia theta CCMP2712]|eukprot:XP_005822692.1 hypothetical protein GUITHDRAFT_118098 [Guillardia theta CCMP2712]